MHDMSVFRIAPIFPELMPRFTEFWVSRAQNQLINSQKEMPNK